MKAIFLSFFFTVLGLCLPAQADVIQNTGDQLTGQLDGLAPTAITAPVGDYGNFQVFFAYAPVEGDVLQLQLFGGDPQSPVVETITWSMPPANGGLVVAPPFGNAFIGPGMDAAWGYFGGAKYTLTMLSGSCDLTSIQVNATLDLDTHSFDSEVDSFPNPVPEPGSLGMLLVFFGCFLGRRKLT